MRIMLYVFIFYSGTLAFNPQLYDYRQEQHGPEDSTTIYLS